MSIGCNLKNFLKDENLELFFIIFFLNNNHIKNIEK